MKTLVTHGHLIDPSQGLNGPADILIEDGKIKGLYTCGTCREQVDSIVDIKGKIISPGLIDLHVHFREPGQEHKEDILSGSQSAVAGGFTSVLCMPNTYPVNDSVEVTKQMIQRAREVNLCKIFPVGAVTKNLMSFELSPLEDLHQAGCIAFSDDGRPVSDTELLKKALLRIKALGSVMMEHCEALEHSCHVTIHDGSVSREMGLKGISTSSETVDVLRMISLCMETGAKVHLSHLSCADSVTLLKQYKNQCPITAEVTPHHLVLTHEEIRKLGTCGKMYPPLRREDDCNKLTMALAEGVIDAVATDHAPHSRIGNPIINRFRSVILRGVNG